MMMMMMMMMIMMMMRRRRRISDNCRISGYLCISYTETIMDRKELIIPSLFFS
jgi:hypothetical protein